MSRCLVSSLRQLQNGHSVASIDSSTPTVLRLRSSVTLAMTSPASRMRVVPHDRDSDAFAFQYLDDRCVLVGALYSDNLRVLYAFEYAVLCEHGFPDGAIALQGS